MAAAKLVTRCPACRTAFRLVADQLRLRQGLVRCGQCDTVFDAREHLIEVPAPAAAPASPPAATPAPVAAPVSMAAALAHAEQTQATAHARENEAPFEPGFDPGYDVPALDSPTTMMSEPEPEDQREAEPEAPTDATHVAATDHVDHVPAEATSPVDPAEAAGNDDATEEVAAEAVPDEPVPDIAVKAAAEGSEAEPASEAPEIETPLTAPPLPWPTLDHSAFDDTPPPAHSSLDPAAAFAPKTPSGMPPSGAYSARATWPPLKAGGAPQALAADAPSSSAATPATPATPDATPVSGSEVDEALPPPNPFPHTEPVRSASEYLRAADPTDAEAEAWAKESADTGDEGPTSRDGTPDAVARETTTRHWLRHDAGPATGPAFAPDFLRHTRIREREQTRPASPKASLPGGRRVWARVAVAVLALGVLAQGAYLARSQIAGRLPVLRPVLEAACEPLGCSVPPWRDLEALRIDSSQLQKQDESSDVYLLAVTMRNQGRATTALPAIELVMTDLQDQLLLRRVLQPAEYLEPDQRAFATTGLRAGSELPVRVRFRTQQAAANYRVLIFYP